LALARLRAVLALLPVLTVLLVLVATLVLLALLTLALLTLTPRPVRTLAEPHEARHPLLRRGSLLAQELAQLLEPLSELLLLFLGHLLFLHPVEVLGGLLQVAGRQPEIAHQVLGGLRKIAIELVELPPRALLLLRLAVEPLELALLLFEQAVLLLVLRSRV